MIPCEAGKADYSHHDPVIVKCGKPATKLVGRGILQYPICDECYGALPEKYQAWVVRKLEKR